MDKIAKPIDVYYCRSAKFRSELQLADRSGPGLVRVPCTATSLEVIS